MSKTKFDALVDETLVCERELRSLTPGKPSLRCFIALCLSRAGEDYSAVEGIKERLADPAFSLKSGTGVFIRDLSKYIASGRIKEPPEKKRIGGLHFNQKDQALFELGGQPEMLFLLWVIAAEIAYQQAPDIFGKVEDLAAHKARIAELEAKRKDLHDKISSRTSWSNDDVIIGRITSDFAALISWRRAPLIAVGMGPEALIEELLDGGGAEAKAA